MTIIAQYKQNYEIKSTDNDADWRKLVELCRALQETPQDKREAEFDKLMNVDEMLWFLAVDNVLIDGDGYFSRASDYTLYLDNALQPVLHFLARQQRDAAVAGRTGDGRSRWSWRSWWPWRSRWPGGPGGGGEAASRWIR